MFLCGDEVVVGDVQRPDVNESSDPQRAVAVVRSLDVVPRELVAIEAGRVDSGVTGALLRRRAEERTPEPCWKPVKQVAKDGEVRHLRGANFLENAWHLAQ